VLEAVLASADIEAVEALACKGFDDRGRVTRGDPLLVECDLEQSVATIRCSSGAAIWKDAAPPHLVASPCSATVMTRTPPASAILRMSGLSGGEGSDSPSLRARGVAAVCTVLG